MKPKRFTATLYKHTDTYVMFIEGDNYRFQEHLSLFEKDVTKNSMLANLYGKRKFKAIFNATKDFIGVMRMFEMTDDLLTVSGLSLHCNGTIHTTGYEEEIWKKGK
jgi:hypothetical protein